jgi:GT2 family glycosyltransferase
MRAVVVDLDMSRPFSAARGRNAGFKKLLEIAPETHFVQFVDGDCELIAGWVNSARNFLQTHTEHAVACGRLYERFPEKSIYNRLCDIEWNGPTGDIKACGGIFMIRAEAFQDVGGMNEMIRAGEEPEMCLRLRGKGWLIHRLDHSMAWHDAGMTTFSQWWWRTVRSGYAFAEGSVLHRNSQEHFCARESMGVWLWATILPVSITLMAGLISKYFLAAFIIYIIQIFKIAYNNKNKIGRKHILIIYSLFIMIGKIPQLYGQILFILKIINK